MPPEEDMVKFIGPPLWDSFMRYCGWSREKADEGVRVFQERYAPIGQFENRAAPGIVELMERLKAKGYVMAVASSKPEDMCRSICTHFGFAPWLDVISGNTAGDALPKSEVIREAMRRLGIGREDLPSALMIGDRKFDVEGAREIGMDCVGVEFFGYAAPGELEEAGAVAVVKTAEELEAFILDCEKEE